MTPNINQLKLIEPSLNFQNEYIRFLDDFKSTGEELIPFVLNYDISNFQDFIQKLKDSSLGIKLCEGRVPDSTFWMIDENNKIIGVVNIRHKLNDKLKRFGGHIGYGIAPSYRRKGYGKIMLKLALEKANELGINKTLLNCEKDNLASANIIKYNNGILDSEDIIEGKEIQRYWIEIKT